MTHDDTMHELMDVTWILLLTYKKSLSDWVYVISGLSPSLWFKSDLIAMKFYTNINASLQDEL